MVCGVVRGGAGVVCGVVGLGSVLCLVLFVFVCFCVWW